MNKTSGYLEITLYVVDVVVVKWNLILIRSIIIIVLHMKNVIKKMYFFLNTNKYKTHIHLFLINSPNDNKKDIFKESL